MAGSHSGGALQPNGQVVPEHMMDVTHVGEAVAYIADLPLGVTVLTFNIMCVLSVGMIAISINYIVCQGYAHAVCRERMIQGHWHSNLYGAPVLL